MAFWMIQIVSVEEMFKLTEKFSTDSLLYSVIMNVTATQYTCSLSNIYCPHWLVQWSHHCSRMCIPVLFPGIPGNMDVVQTIVIILKMVWLFLNRLTHFFVTYFSKFSIDQIYAYVYTFTYIHLCCIHIYYINMTNFTIYVHMIMYMYMCIDTYICKYLHIFTYTKICTYTLLHLEFIV